jgi:predicted nuclease of predicted toxin-antitoxin system
MKLLLDQGLPLSAAALLCDAGVDTLHVGEIGMSEAEDAEIIQRARDEGRVVATLDADFHTLLALDEATSPSIIRIRIERLRAQALTDLLLMVTAKCEEDIEQGSAITVEPSRIRIRRLPLVPDV